MGFKSSFTIPAVAAISFCLIGGTSTTPAYADLGDQLFKLTAKDGFAADNFGISVAINGTTAIVGSEDDDDNGNGNNSGSAYLFDAAGTSPCPWDIEGTGSVGASDLLSLLVSWGPCKGCCPAEFDDNGNVGASDLLALLVNWGPCA